MNSVYNIMVEWETRETSVVPLKQFFEDARYKYALYVIKKIYLISVVGNNASVLHG